MNDKFLKLCIAPTEIFWGDKKQNLKNLPLIFNHIHPETDLLVLPELFSTGFTSDKSIETFKDMAESNSGQTVMLLKKLSETHNIAIAGSFMAESDNKLYNRAFFIEPAGDEYFADKRHLFSLGGEDLVFNPGNTRLKVRYRGWKIALIVCYDLRFPVWCRNRKNEYDLLLCVANWPASRIETWDTLLKARAIENLSYVCGVNCTGIDNKDAEYNGLSKVYNYSGKDITVKISDDGLLYASLSMQKLENYRDKFTFWKDIDKFTIEDIG